MRAHVNRGFYFCSAVSVSTNFCALGAAARAARACRAMSPRGGFKGGRAFGSMTGEPGCATPVATVSFVPGAADCCLARACLGSCPKARVSNARLARNNFNDVFIELTLDLDGAFDGDLDDSCAASPIVRCYLLECTSGSIGCGGNMPVCCRKGAA